MKKLCDMQGREWSYSLNILSMKRIKDLVGIDLLNAAETAQRVIFDDPYTFGQILYCLCQRQAEERGVSQDQFLEGLAGECLDAALTGFVEEWRDFFPQSRKVHRVVLERMVRLRALYEAEAAKQAEEHLQRLEDQDEISKAISQQIASAKTHGS
jgi:hypothetical protein